MPSLQIASAPNACLDSAQTYAVCKLAKVERSIAWWRVGTGKTRLSIALALHTSPPNELPYIILVVTRIAIAYDWESEFQKIGLDVAIRTDCSYSEKKITCWIVSYAKIEAERRLRCEGWKYVKRIIVDELFLFSNPTTKRSQEVRRLSGCRPSIGLSGSIATTNDNFKVWGQLCALNLERYVARGATEFRTLYQNSYLQKVRDRKFKVYSPASNWKKKLLSRIEENVSIFMPPVLQRTVTRISKFSLTNEQANLIRSAKDLFILEYEDHIKDFSYSFQTVQAIRGILNGWIHLDKKKVDIRSRKKEGLLARVSSLCEAGESVVVWCAFRRDIAILRKELPFASLQMVGGERFDIARYERNPSLPVFATLGSGSGVNHFGKVPYCIFYSLSNKPFDIQQAKGRFTRKDSGLEGVYYEFMEIEGSYDERLRDNFNGAQIGEKQLIETWINEILSASSPVAS